MQPVALVPRDVDVPFAILSLVSSAIQIQLTRDVGPAWGLQATCSPFPTLQDVPNGYWIVFLVNDARGRAGLHFRPTHPDEPPFAVVQFVPEGRWSVAASHEVIELLVDPIGSRLFPGLDPINPSKNVSFLAEPCDPCQDISCAYQVDHAHSVLVSDFCLPSFYGFGAGAAPYTLRRSILAPLSVASGGYLSWRDSNNSWFQMRALGGPTRVIGPLKEEDILGSNTEHGNLRGALDRLEPNYIGAVSKDSQSRKYRKYASIQKTAQLKQRQRDKVLNGYLGELGF